MRRFLNGCGEHREKLCLLASGVLPKNESREVELHLVGCAACQEYYEGIKSVTEPMAGWEKTFSRVEPDETLRARWARDFQAAIEPVSARRVAVLNSILDWCRDMVWPCRRAWSATAVVWLAIFAISFSTHDNLETLGLRASRPSAEMVRALLEQDGVLAELIKPDNNQKVKKPDPFAPAPRSDRRAGASRT